MKKYFLMLAVALATGMMFTSCGDDEDEGGSTPSGTSSKLGYLDDGQGNSQLPAGYAVKTVNGYGFYYDEDGNLSQISDDGDYINFSTKGISVTDDEGTMKLSFNGKGFISKASSTYSYTEDGTTIKGTEEYSFSYNSNNQITSIKGSLKNSIAGNGSEISVKGEGTATYTYNGTKLQKVATNTKESGMGVSYTESSTYTFDYSSGYPNIYGQWTPNLLNASPGGDIFEALAYVGCFGRASSILPDVIYEEYVEDIYGEEDTDKDSYNCSYSYNSYGALTKADGCSYTYTTGGSSPSKAPRVVPTAAHKTSNLFGMFRHKF